MGVPYDPPGFLGLINAALFVARHTHPDRWNADAVPDPEAAFWRELSRRRHPEFVQDLLSVEVDGSGITAIERLCDFKDAQSALRDHLVEGLLQVTYLDDQGLKQSISPHTWGSEGGLNALTNGAAWIDEPGNDYVFRYLLISKSALAFLLTGAAPASEGQPTASAEHGNSPKLMAAMDALAAIDPERKMVATPAHKTISLAIVKWCRSQDPPRPIPGERVCRDAVYRWKAKS